MATEKKSNRVGILDKTHGFMKFIIKNQVERDNYDKEQRRNEKPNRNNADKIKTNHYQGSSRGRVAERYPHQNKGKSCKINGDLDEIPSKIASPALGRMLFNLEFLTNDGHVILVPVKEGDTASAVVKNVTDQYPLDKSKQNLLNKRVTNEIKKFRPVGNF